MEAFVITLREGVEAALIIVLVLTYLDQTGRRHLNRWVYYGLVLAIIVSLLGAFGFSRIGIDPEDELVEGILYGLAAILVVSLVAWMWRASRGIKQHVEQRVEELASSTSRRQGLGLLAFVFFMVFREGIETVLFLAALSLTKTPDIISLIGGLVGLGLAAVFAVLFMRGSLRINFRYFFAITGFILLVLAIRLAAGSLHEFYEAGIIRLPEVMEEGIEFLTADGTSTVILIALITLPVLSIMPVKWLKPLNGQASQ